ncbi:MAG TPA: ATPase domain-containing protein [Candidatus Bathyarchaeia archaeon]
MRLQTGIHALDDMLSGGFLPGDAVLLAGGAGTGKTTLALQHLVNGATQFGENGIYVTFEQLPTQIYRDSENLGWDIRKLEDENKFRLICTSPNILLETDGGESILSEPIREIHAQRIVIDSLSHLAMYTGRNELRRELYRLIMLFKARGLGSLLVWESGEPSGQSTSWPDGGIGFLVDCIVSLKPVEIESAIRKALVIWKMRGSDHDKRLREYEITSRGIEVSAPFSNYEGLLTGSPRRSITEEAANNWAMAFAKNKQNHS